MNQEEYSQTVAAQEEYEAKVTRPITSLLDQKFVYRKSTQTNVQETWKRFGWKPKPTPKLQDITKMALEILEQELANANQR